MNILLFVVHLYAFQPSSYEPLTDDVPTGIASKVVVDGGLDPIRNAFALLETQEAWIAKLKELKASGEITEEEYKSLLRDEIGDI